MNYLFDLHTHTLASGHAYGSFTDNIAAARKRGLWGLGVSEHSSSMPGAPQPIFFTNFKVIPDIIDGLHVFTGMELNIIDYEGHVDMEERILQKVDYIIASLHKDCIQSGSVEENTSALIDAMKNPYVKILGHPDDDRFPVDYERLVEAASHEHIAMEINNSSASPRNGRTGAEKIFLRCWNIVSSIRFLSLPAVTRISMSEICSGRTPFCKTPVFLNLSF